MRTRWRLLIGIAGGVAIALPALSLAIASAGAGHGDYAYAKVLFPYSMLLTRLADETISAPLIGLALLQFPLYGLGCALFSPGRRLIGSVGLATLHIGAVAACFAGLLPTFS